MDKVAVTTRLQAYGASLAEAHRAVEGVLQGKVTAVNIREGLKMDEVYVELEMLGLRLTT